MDTKQLQCLLTYLGYDTGGVDGIAGKKTKAAVTAFCRDRGLQEAAVQEGLKAAVWEAPEPESFWEGIRYFSRGEWRCTCGGKYCNGFPAEPKEALVRAAEALREALGEPITISSGVRCPQRNSEVGGVANSRHLSGKAMDFSVSGHRAEAVLAQVKKLPGVRYAYAIGVKHVHMDIE